MAKQDTQAPKMGGGPGGGGGPGHGSAVAMEKPRNLRRTLGRLFRYLGKSKGLIALVVVALIVNSLSSVAGTYMIGPLIDNYILPGDFVGLAKGLALLAGIYLAGILASYLMMRTGIRLAQKTVNIVRGELFDKMQNLPLQYYDTHTHGELMSRFSNDAENVQNMLEQSLAQLLSSAIMFVGIVAVMLYLNAMLFVVTALIIVFMIFVVSRVGKHSSRFFQKQQAILGKLNGSIEESMGGLREIKAFNHQDISIDEFSTLNEHFQAAAETANFSAGSIMPIMVNLNNMSYAFSAVVGGVLAAFGKFSIGSLASYLQFSRQIGRPINQISGQMNNIYSAAAGAERIFDMMDQQPEVDEGTVTLEKSADGTHWHWNSPDGTRTPLKGDVRFHDVTFSYDGVKTVLHNVSLYAKPGQMIAFVGSTGAGKTTITNLINRFYDVQEGSITYDGIDVRAIKKDDLRHSLGMVLQDTHLFTDTVMNNIRYGRLDATDDECIEAAKKAGAHSFISRLPRGYKTRLESDGGNLSQGQRQLLAIARTYIARPPVMILDEATSSIDTRTEQQLQKAMDVLMEGRTVFVIAHRLSTVQGAKAIIVLENGKIIERGSHSELLEQEGRYYQLHHGLAELA